MKKAEGKGGQAGVVAALACVFDWEYACIVAGEKCKKPRRFRVMGFSAALEYGHFPRVFEGSAARMDAYDWDTRNAKARRRLRAR